jgi:RNA-directed DNA polymerase
VGSFLFAGHVAHPMVMAAIEAKRKRTSVGLRTEIEKDNGGVRLLGIPTVKDRVVQQAFHQL